MFESMKKPRYVALAAVGVLAVGAGPAMAHKDPMVSGGGKINLTYGSTALTNVSVGEAARIAAAACGTKVGAQAKVIARVEARNVMTDTVLCTNETYGVVKVVDVDGKHTHGHGSLPEGVATNGRVNIVIGASAPLTNLSIGWAAKIAATACSTKVGPQARVIARVERTGVEAVLCTSTTLGVVKAVDVDAA